MKEKPGILLIAALDTKEEEARYIENILVNEGVAVYILDPGILGEVSYKASIRREEVAQAGGTTLAAVRAVGHEGKAQEMMMSGAIKCALELYEKKKIEGIISIGGSMGTNMGTTVMRAFPVGFPKVMISTMASGNTRDFVGTKDILMLPSICDIAGLNRVLRKVLHNGALALAGMVTGHPMMEEKEKPVVAMSTLGTTDGCATVVRKELSKAGYEVMTFHTNGTGGAALDEMVRENQVSAVVDLSLHEIVTHRFGGIFDAGPDRSKAALEMGIPTVFAPGNIDFLVTGPLEGAKKNFPGKKLHIHNSAITAVRVTQEELKEIAGMLSDMWNRAKGPISVFVPTKGFSAHDSELGHLHEPESPPAFIEPLKTALNGTIKLQVIPCHINDRQFAEALVKGLKEIMPQG